MNSRVSGRRSLAASLCFLLGLSMGAPLASQAAPTARGLLSEAESLRFEGNWYAAIESYLSALAKNPSYGEAMAGLADCYYELEEYDQALSYARKAKTYLRDSADIVNLEGFILVGQGEAATARRAFASVLASRPNDLDARFGMGLIDLASGKKSEARSKLEDSLRIAPQNGRALLSLALIARDQGRKDEARALVERALRYHGDDPRTHYIAALLALSEGDGARAAAQARTALDQRPSYSEARLLLASIMYAAASYDEAIILMREALARNREDGMAWYTLGLAQAASGRTDDAVYSFRTAVGQRPDDELARIALERTVMSGTRAEDQSRQAFAEWHFQRASQFAERSFYDQAIAECRRGLKVYPYAVKGRILYAELLRARGMPAKYLAELKFLRDNDRADRDVLDAIETYDSLLADSLARAWNVDETSLVKRPYKVALMYAPSSESMVHVDAQRALVDYLGDILAASSRLGLIAVEPRAESFSQAFRRAREAGADYYAMVTVSETERALAIDLELRVARTGSPAARISAYRSGNDRVKNCAARIAFLLEASLEPKGIIIKRNQDRVLVDLGKSDGVAAGDKLLVLKRGVLTVKPEALGPAYAASDILGRIEVTRVGEECCEGNLSRAGFFDTVNIGDETIVAPKDASTRQPEPKPDARDQWPGLLNLIRKLR